MANNENITKENQTNELVVRREKLSALFAPIEIGAIEAMRDEVARGLPEADLEFGII